MQQWREIGGKVDAAPGRAEADRSTGLCPEGHGILLRARVESGDTFYIERCGHCRGVWFDEGEWHRLAAVDFLDRIGDLWDPLWRASRREAASRKQLDRALADALGEAHFQRLSAVMDGLESHPARAQVVAWISERLQKR